MAKDVQVYDGTNWHSIKGPKGDDGAKGDAGVPGPTEVSADAGNASVLGSDGKIFTPAVIASDADPEPAGYEPDAGNSEEYARADHVHILPDIGMYGLSPVVESGSYNDLIDKPTIPAASTTVGKPDTPLGAAGTSDAYARADHVHQLSSISTAYITGLATVAETGSYNDLTDKPVDALPLTGGTVTGEVVVSPAVGPSHPSGSLRVIGDNTPAILSVQRNGGVVANLDMPQLQFNRTRGTTAAPEPVQAGDFLGRIIWRGGRAVSGGPQTSAQILAVCTRANVAGEMVVAGEIRMQPAGLLTNGTIGQRVIQNLTSAGTTFAGEENTFQQGSVNSTAIGPLNIVTANANRTFLATDAGKVVQSFPPANTDVTLTLPAAGAAGFVAGLVIEVIGNPATAGKYVFIQAPAGVSLFFNSPTGGSGDGSLGGGAATRCRLRGPMTSMRLMCVDAGFTWYAFGDLVGA